MSTQGKPTVTRADADSVVQKLEELRRGLNAKEQLVLDNVFEVVAEKFRDPSVRELMKDFPDAPELLEDVAGFRLAAPQDPQEVIVITPTVTTITVATTSRLLCLKAAGS
jgi:hypothetical protein